MKKYYLVILVFIALAITTTLAGLMNRNLNGEEQYRLKRANEDCKRGSKVVNPYNCREYYECNSSGHYSARPCPRGKVVNPDSLVCNDEKITSCAEIADY